MNLIKKICALGCAGALSLAMLAAMPASAYDYESMGIRTMKQIEMSKWGKKAKDVLTGPRYGGTKSGELWQLGCSSTSTVQAQSKTAGGTCIDDWGNLYYMYSHQARVSSGGKFKETAYVGTRYLATTSRISVKNGVANFEAYYRYNL